MPHVRGACACPLGCAPAPARAFACVHVRSGVCAWRAIMRPDCIFGFVSECSLINACLPCLLLLTLEPMLQRARVPALASGRACHSIPCALRVARARMCFRAPPDTLTSTTRSVRMHPGSRFCGCPMCWHRLGAFAPNLVAFWRADLFNLIQARRAPPFLPVFWLLLLACVLVRVCVLRFIFGPILIDCVGDLGLWLSSLLALVKV